MRKADTWLQRYGMKNLLIDEVKSDTFYSLDWQMFPNYKRFLHEN